MYFSSAERKPGCKFAYSSIKNYFIGTCTDTSSPQATLLFSNVLRWSEGWLKAIDPIVSIASAKSNAIARNWGWGPMCGAVCGGFAGDKSVPKPLGARGVCSVLVQKPLAEMPVTGIKQEFVSQPNTNLRNRSRQETSLEGSIISVLF